MKRKLMACRCRCGHEWTDHPGAFALLTKPQYDGDPTNGCPRCRSLYWTETEL